MPSVSNSSLIVSETIPVNEVSLQSQLQSRAERLSRLVARNIFSTPTLYPEQVDVLIRLALMQFKDSPIKPPFILFVHLTGGGKLLVRDVHSVLFPGISLTIVPVLSLGTDLSLNVR